MRLAAQAAGHAACHLPARLLAGITYLQIAVPSPEQQHFEKQCQIPRMGAAPQ